MVKFYQAAAIVLAIDQITKILVKTFQPDVSFVWRTHYVENTGAGFGILQGQSLWLGILSFLVAAIIIWKHKEAITFKNSDILVGMFLGGVLGNGIDRLLRRYVIDFIDFGWWPAFNIADAAICISVVLYIILDYKKERKKKN